MLRAILALSLTMWSASGCTPLPSSEDDPDTETGIFLPSTGGGSSGESGGDEGGDDGSGSGGATEGDALLPACQDRDPTTKTAMSVSYGAWGKPDIISQPSRTISAECYVQAYTWSAGVLHLGLDCTAGDLIDQTLLADIDITEPPQTMLPPGAKVYLSGGWSLEGGVSREHFIVFDALGRLRLASLRNMIGEASASLWPLQLAQITDACPWVCAGDCAEGGDPTRRDAILVAHEGGGSVEVLDGQRGEFTADNMHFEVLVGEALETYVDHVTSFRSSLVLLGTPGV